MTKRALFSKLKSIAKGAATLAILSFGFQSIALPIHTAVHTIERSANFARSSIPTFTSNTAACTSAEIPSQAITESDCDLCDFASHQALQGSLFVHFEDVESIATLTESIPAALIFVRPILLPPARGPPVRA
jgi:hypothetical protein